jgi:hypothetical protein
MLLIAAHAILSIFGDFPSPQILLGVGACRPNAVCPKTSSCAGGVGYAMGGGCEARRTFRFNVPADLRNHMRRLQRCRVMALYGGFERVGT